MEMMVDKKNLKRYEAYKDSGVDWIGEIPRHWEVRKIKHTTYVKGRIGWKGLRSDEFSYNDDVYCVTGTNFKGKNIDWSKCYQIGKKRYDEDPYIQLKKGDLLITKDGTIGKTVIINTLPKPATLNSGIFVTRALKNDYITNYLYWIFNSKIFEDFIKITNTGATILHLYQNVFVNFTYPCPKIQEQTRIANFLDQKCAKIDQAIQQKERLIELLQERKQIIIQNAVTRGLNPEVEMKDSGVDWIGEVPAHWEIRRSKFLFSQRRERARFNDIQLSATQAYGVIPQAEYEKRIGRRVVKIESHLEKRKHVEINDFVISMRSFQGGLERAWASGCIRSSYVILQPLEPIDSDFYAYLFKIKSYIQALQATGSFIRDGQDLNFGNFSKVDLLIPPLNEQKEIVLYLDQSKTKIASAIKYYEQQIKKLKEYKQILINEVVTGKVKV